MKRTPVYGSRLPSMKSSFAISRIFKSDMGEFFFYVDMKNFLMSTRQLYDVVSESKICHSFARTEHNRYDDHAR